MNKKIVITISIIIVATIATLSSESIRARFFFNKSTINPISSLNDGLVGYWTFDGEDVDWGTKFSVRDKSGQGNHASTTLATSTAPTEGVLGQAFDFSDSDGYVNVPTDSSLELTTTMTVSAWIKPTADDVGTQFDIFNKMSSNGAEGAGSAGRGGYYLGNDTNGGSGSPNRWCFTLSNSGGTSNVCSTLTLEAGKWYHLVGTYDADAGTPRRLYTNGVQTTSNGTVFTPTVISNISAYIGGGGFNNGAGWTGGNYFNGVIDEIRVYNRALSAEEVKALHSQTKPNRNLVNTSGGFDNLNSDLVGYWTFDGADVDWATGAVTDRSGSGNNGTVSGLGTTTASTEGVSGQALEFDGSDDYVTIADTDTLTFGNDTVDEPFSFSLWVKLNAFDALGGLIGKWNAQAGTNEWVAFTSNTVNGDVRFILRDASTGGDIEALTGAVLSLNTWAHVVGTYDGSESQSGLVIYVNGTTVASTNSVSGSYTAMENTSNNVDIGRFIDGGGVVDDINGTLDEVRVYSRALTASEVEVLYNQTKPARNVVNKTVTRGGLGSGLVGHWTFDGPDVDWATGAVTDRSGTGNNGSIIDLSTTTAPIEGIHGQAFNFSTSTKSVTIPDDDTLDFADAVSVSTWIKINIDPETAQHVIVSKPSLGTTSGFTLEYRLITGVSYDYVFDVQFTDLGGRASTAKASGISRGVWHHVVGVADSNARIYIDGVLAGEGSSFTESIKVNNSNINISGLNSDMDDVRIYNRALSVDEIKQLYEMGK